jgi:hypothetical protein
MNVSDETKYLGKIESLRLGMVTGRDDCWFGIRFSLTYDGGWSISTERVIRDADDVTWLSKLLEDAKVKEVKDLVNVPIEVTFSADRPSGPLHSWRILTEVI